MQLNHEILSEKLVEDKLVGMSIIMISDVVEELKDDPDFNHEAYRSILTAELETIHKEMKDTCRMCQLEDEKACCESDCKLFEKAVEYHENINADYDICYHCPEKDKGCLGFDYCRFRNLDEKLSIKDVHLSADALLWASVITEDDYFALCDKGLRFISAFDYESVLDVVGPYVMRKVQQNFFILMERHFGSYLPGLVEAVGESESKVSKRVVQFEEDFKEYIASKRAISRKETSASKNFTIAIKKTSAKNSFIGVLIDNSSESRKPLKFIIKSEYISVKGSLPEGALNLIESKICNEFNENFKMPSRVMRY